MIAVLTILGISDYTIRQRADLAMNQAVGAKLAEVDSYLRLVEKYCLSHAALYSRDSRVLEAYAIAHSGDIDDEADAMAAQARQLLRAAFAPLQQSFAEVTGETSYRLHFHLPTGRSLCRIWRDSQAGSDDLSSFRKTVLDINAGTHAPITGVEIGRGGFVIRGLAPITGPNGKHLGSVEMLSPYAPLIMAAKTDSKQSYGIFMNAEFLPTATKLADRGAHPLVGDRFVMVTSTDKDVVLPLASEELLEAGARQLTQVDRGNYRLTLFPINDYEGKQIGVIVYALDHSEFTASLAKLRLTMLLIAFAMIAALGALAFWTTRAITAPLQEAVTVAEAVAAGDLTSKMEIDRDDELGDLGRALNSMIDSLHEVTSQLREGSHTLRGTVSDLNGRSTDLSEDSEKMALAADTVSSATEQLSSNVQKIAGSAEEMSGLLTAVATSIDEMTSSVQEVAQNAGRGSQIVQQASSRSRATVEIMERLQDASEKIGKVLDVITAIAGQTNLLALNATIEAASAGEAGRGFSVVANEVKDLARQTTQAAEEINREIKEMQASTASAAEAIESIVSVIVEVDAITASIAAAVEEQSATLGEIADSGSVASSSAQEIARRVQEGADGTREIARSVLAVRDGVQATDQGLRETLGDSERLATLAASMDEMVSRFSV
jgi:methyl-accepting chemotaxis protein